MGGTLRPNNPPTSKIGSWPMDYSERLFHLADTYEILSAMPSIFFRKWSYDKARVENSCELVNARKLVKARELQYLGVSFTWNLIHLSD